MPKEPAVVPSAHLPEAVDALPFAPFFLEYATRGSVGWFTVEGTSIPDAIVKASGAIQGLECIRAALRQAPDRRVGFGEGRVLALYTPANGWKSATAGLEWLFH